MIACSGWGWSLAVGPPTTGAWSASLTRAGRRLLDAVTQRRREELIDLARRLPESDAAALTGALRQLNTAMDEVGDDHWEPAPAPATDAS